MSKTVYVDIGSANRNRNNDANTYNFTVTPGASSNLSNALSPVSDSFPVATVVLGQNPDAQHLAFDATFYVNYYVQIGDETHKVESYDPDTGIAELDAPFTTAPAQGDSVLLRYSLPFARGVVIDSPENNRFGFLTDLALSYVPASFLRVEGSNDAYQIQAFDPMTQRVTLSQPLPAPLSPGDTFEINAVSRDNAVSFQPVQVEQPHELTLMWMAVPNRPWWHDRLPYVYVEISNTNDRNVQSLLTNNPNARNAVFKVPVTDHHDGAFLILKDCKQSVASSLRFDLAIKVTVTDPSGNILEGTDDSRTPARLDPLAQMSLMFGVRWSTANAAVGVSGRGGIPFGTSPGVW